MVLQDFIDVYYKARTSKRKSKDSIAFEMHMERNLCRLIKSLESHTFTPSAYTFIVDKPRPREIFACEMSLRICDHYFDEKTRNLIEARMTNRSFNNRIGYGGLKAINTLITDIYDASEGFTQDAWVIKMDLKGYFPNAVQDIAYKQLSEIVLQDYQGEDKDLLLYIIMRCIYSYPVENCERRSPLCKWEDYPADKSLFHKPPGIGGAIGRLLWQIAMSFYLNDFDHYVVDTCGLRYIRFVDDMTIVTTNKEVVLSMIPTFRKMLAEYGCTLHPKKFYCQHWSKGVEFLGAIIKKDRVYVSKRVCRNMKAAIHKFNRCPGKRNLEAFMSSLNSYFGILKGRNSYRIILKMVESINPSWWKYCHFDNHRLCLNANDGYTHVQLLERKYHIKLRKNGNRRKNQRSGGRNPGPKGDFQRKRRSCS